jgi:hypothetical protein
MPMFTWCDSGMLFGVHVTGATSLHIRECCFSQASVNVNDVNMTCNLQAWESE